MPPARRGHTSRLEWLCYRGARAQSTGLHKTGPLTRRWPKTRLKLYPRAQTNEGSQFGWIESAMQQWQQQQRRRHTGKLERRRSGDARKEPNDVRPRTPAAHAHTTQRRARRLERGGSKGERMDEAKEEETKDKSNEGEMESKSWHRGGPGLTEQRAR